MVPMHGHYQYLTSQQALTGEISCELSGSESVTNWNVMQTSEGSVALLDHSTFDDISANWIRSIENDEFLSGFLCDFRGEGHRPDIRVHARADILNVVDKNIDVVEHLS